MRLPAVLNQDSQSAEADVAHRRTDHNSQRLAKDGAHQQLAARFDFVIGHGQAPFSMNDHQMPGSSR